MINVECIWFEVTIQHRKLLIGTFYRPPNSTNEILSSIEDSIGMAFDTNIQNILMTGDFNLDMFKQNSSRKVSNICQYFGLEKSYIGTNSFYRKLNVTYRFIFNLK